MADEKQFIGDICVDFDGTIVKHEYPNVGAPEKYVKEVLEAFRQVGYRIIIYSCRTCSWYPEIFNTEQEDLSTPEARMNRAVARDMKATLDLYQIPYDVIDDGSLGKPMAAFYIDDKGLRYDGDWLAVGEFVLRHTPGIITKLGLGDTNK